MLELYSMIEKKLTPNLDRYIAKLKENVQVSEKQEVTIRELFVNYGFDCFADSEVRKEVLTEEITDWLENV